ncbi:serine/threonine-protein kinase [Amycolatopsis sp. cg5]|uniref:serine/threonine-protein kinase n=1 Tax=Amycolatopsis sp. cg5 TaxID=3238802 RepID=UPI003523EF5D
MTIGDRRLDDRTRRQLDFRVSSAPRSAIAPVAGRRNNLMPEVGESAVRGQLLWDRYRLVKLLGEGGMGEVWEAQDETLGRPVAIKVVSRLAGGGDRGDEVRARFLREARITARLQQHNIVTLHDLGETGQEGSRVPFLVMELIRGEGLDVKLRHGAVSLADAARWGAQICDALAGAHDIGIMHRDIKPSNILITASGSVKVLDFGIARAADPCVTEDRLTRTGFVVGTPAYMSPEQARGVAEPRSDLYALGCLIFELITGRLPFQASGPMDYLTAHLTQEPPAPSSVREEIPPAWDKLVLTLLSKEPGQRYPSATVVGQTLRELATAPESPAGNKVRAALNSTAEMPSVASFDVSWTGQERLSGYAARASTVAPWLVVLVAGAISVASFYFPLHLGLVTPPATEKQIGWVVLMSIGGGIGGLVGFVASFWVIRAAIADLKLVCARKTRSRWSLHIGPHGIVTESTAGRREIPWSQIQHVTVEEIRQRAPGRYTGVHVELEPGAGIPVILRPAGWPYPESNMLTPRPSIPTCVVGPLSERQRTDLVDALAAHGGERWVPSVHFTTHPVRS